MNVRGHIAIKSGCFVEWSVNFFAESPDVDERWISPPFDLSGETWFLRLYPNGRTSMSAGWISLYLVKEKSNHKIQDLSFTLGIKANNDIQHNCRTFTNSFNELLNGCGAFKLLLRGELLQNKNTLSSDGVVTFFCEFGLVQGYAKVDAETQTSLQDGCCRLTQDLKELFLREEGADVTIKVKGKEFRVHSQILSARSSVLAAMFRHDTKEKNTGVVEIPEFEPDAFREFLIFLYSGQTEKLSADIDIDLYSAADKYDIEELKTICSEFMKENITVDSFCDVLSLAIRHGDKCLIDYLTDYFVKNVKKIIVTLKWMAFAKEHPTESNELVIILAHHFVPD